MKVKGKHSESEILHAIILIAAAVISVIVFIVVLILTGGGFGKPSDKKPETSTSTTASTTAPKEAQGFVPDEELSNEMMDAASKLIENNYYVICLYYVEGLPHKDEPYGNTPEDGYYTVNSEKYSTLEELEALVDSTYTDDVAAKVKADSLGYGAIYKTRPNGTLGIHANFTPYPYTISWETPRFAPHPVSETECELTITVHEQTDGSEVQLKGVMTKTSDGWRLKNVILLPE